MNIILPFYPLQITATNSYLLASTTIYDSNSKSNTLNNKQTRELASRACLLFIKLIGLNIKLHPPNIAYNETLILLMKKVVN